MAVSALVNADTKSALEHARELASHVVPDGDWNEFLRHMAQSYIEFQTKKKAKQTDTPKPATTASSSIPAAVKREVWQRDGGCCSWRGPGDRRCGSRWRLEFDHIVPVGQGGTSTADNIRLLCGRHNQLHADHMYGSEFMDQFRQPTDSGHSIEGSNGPPP